MKNKSVDLLIIGGGINGVGICADAAGRGISTILCEQHDLASGTSSASSKLIHGGLRYLEHYEFHLVRESLREREILLKKAPHIIRPLQFILPHQQSLRPAWMIRAGLFLYDHLGGRKHLPGSAKLNLGSHAAGKPLQPGFKTGFSYYDCLVNDARLVVLNAMAARDKGATILTRTKCINAKRQTSGWEILLEHVVTGEQSNIHARVLVNAAGPWEELVNKNILHYPTQHSLQLVQGSHIVVRAFYQGKHAYILQNFDQRIVFVIPFEEKFALIGTTDVPYQGDPSDVAISAEEIRYLLAAVNRYFTKKIVAADILWSYAGVRALKAEAAVSVSRISRDYSLELDEEPGLPPMLHVIGGKITTYRRLAEQALTKLSRYFPDIAGNWTASSVLPGGDFDDCNQFAAAFCHRYPWLPRELAHRYVRYYGQLAHSFLRPCHAMQDLGKHFGAGLYQLEIEYLCAEEWAETAEDILWRRTKLGLLMNESDQANLKKWITNFLGRDNHKSSSNKFEKKYL